MTTGPHRRVRTAYDGAFVVYCHCGWTSKPAVSPDQAELRWDIHLQWARAVQTQEHASAIHQSTTDRMSELSEMRAAARMRRSEIGRRRSALRAELHRRRGMVTVRQRPRSLELVERARILAGLTTTELWVDYFALGGEASLPELSEALRSHAHFEPREYDLLVLALNERFTEAGLGRPLDP
jgi:hypothetical protein